MEPQKLINDSSFLWDHVIDYNLQMLQVLGSSAPRPNYDLSCTLNFTSSFGKRVSRYLHSAALDFEISLIEDLDANDVTGCLVEFGVYKGRRLNKWLNYLDSFSRLQRNVFGFDSFEGLPSPTDRDYPGWEVGQFGDISLESLSSRLKAAERGYLQLIPGWVEDTLTNDVAVKLSRVAFAMFDMDLFEPTRYALDFIGPLLVDNSILGFDDWAYSTEKSESAALFEWSKANPDLKLEFIAAFAWRVYFRVKRLSSN